MIFDLNFSYWAWFGTIYLIFLAIQDYRDKMLVDDRKNYFMYGITLSLLSHIRRPILYTLTLIVVTVVMTIILNKKKVMGEADLNTFNWLWVGMGIINVYRLFMLGIILTTLTVAYTLLKKHVFKYKKPVPYYGVILMSFVLTCIAGGLY